MSINQHKYKSCIDTRQFISVCETKAFFIIDLQLAHGSFNLTLGVLYLNKLLNIDYSI